MLTGQRLFLWGLITVVEMAVLLLRTVAEVGGEGVIANSIGPDLDIGEVVARGDG